MVSIVLLRFYSLAVTELRSPAAGMLLPFTPLARPLGIVPLPAAFFACLGAATVT